ncbi:MAG: sigma-70 family RNA polymerase sigma factor [Firmicutes bacterium]|nr:sigma-70 family RNA polymerase sigma factor [Bacillota bacterium]
MTILNLTNDTIYNAVDLYSTLLFRICFCHVKNKQDSEDIVQEVFLTLHKNRPALASQDHLKAWLIKVATNKAKNHLRYNTKKRTLPLDENIIAKYDLDSDNADLLNAISKLKPVDKNIVFLYYYDGQSTKQIAKLLNKNENAISKRLQRVKQKLKMMLEEK